METPIREGLHDLGKVAGNIATETKNMVSENASQYYNKGLKQAKNLEKGLEKNIQEHPVRTFLVVAGIGLVMSALWTRR